MSAIAILVCAALLLADVAESAPAVGRTANERADGINDIPFCPPDLIISLAPSIIVPVVPLAAVSIIIVLALVIAALFMKTTSIVDILRGGVKKRSSKREYREFFTCCDASRIERIASSPLLAREQRSPSKTSEFSSFSNYNGGRANGFSAIELSDASTRCASVAHPEMAKLSPVEKTQIPFPVFPLPPLPQHALAAVDTDRIGGEKLTG
jgi:hypothetical protein